jgi:hypothetical protein
VGFLGDGAEEVFEGMLGEEIRSFSIKQVILSVYFVKMKCTGVFM